MDINVKDFGAIPDGASVNTEIIQKAIDECFESGGLPLPKHHENAFFIGRTVRTIVRPFLRYWFGCRGGAVAR